MKIKSFDLPFTVNLTNKQELSNYLQIILKVTII